MNNVKVGRGHINTMILATWGRTFSLTDNRILRIDDIYVVEGVHVEMAAQIYSQIGLD